MRVQDIRKLLENFQDDEELPIMMTFGDHSQKPVKIQLRTTVYYPHDRVWCEDFGPDDLPEGEENEDWVRMPALVIV